MRVPVIVWVGPVPAKASGAGMLLMLASSLPAVAPGSQTGPLDPVDLLHPDAQPPGLDAQIDRWLAARGRSVDRSHEDEAMTAQQAKDGGFAEVASPSVVDLLNQIDGTPVPTASGEVVLHTHVATSEADAQAGRGVSIRFGEPGPVKRLEHAVASPSMIYFLLVFGLSCLAFEQTQPGFGFAGFAGLFLIALGAYGITVVPPTWYGLAVMLAGLGALALDVRLRRFGPLTWGGILVFALGSFLVYGQVAGAIRVSPWLIAGATIGVFLFFGFGMTVAIKSRDRIVAAQRGLIGLVGEARGTLAPDGPVFVKGALWRGRSLGDRIDSGTRVRVRGVDGLVLKVEPEPEALASND
jgi:membrane-bound serine protease (ClpP class)